ncbi:MAG TPA: putative lipid II flippase FtsW [Gaiellaceae bacterium]|nr:putative lipid II flippase FtsW [Gaiellaceae bacterium]
MKRDTRGGLEYHLLVLVTLGLVAFGLVMVYSASSARAALAADDPAYYLKRQALYALAGIVALALLSRTDYRRLRFAAGPLLLVSFVLLLAVLVLGDPVNGARRWLSFGPATLQASEVAKLGLVLWVCAYLARRPAPQTLGELLRPIGIVVGTALALVVVEPDLGTAITIAIMVAAVLVVAGTRVATLAGASGIGFFLALAAIWIEPYRRERLLAFLDPWQDPENAGFQSVQAMLALGSGGLFGNGLGESIQKVYYLPESSTDMIFAIVGEELGLLGAVAVIAAFVAFGYAGFNIALASREPFGKLLATGITALVCGQAALNVSAVMGIAPLTGIPLPFVSYGGSSLVIGLALVGILLNIAVSHAEGARAELPDRRRRNRGSRPAGARGRRVAQEPRRPRRARRTA